MRVFSLFIGFTVMVFAFGARAAFGEEKEALKGTMILRFHEGGPPKDKSRVFLIEKEQGLVKWHNFRRVKQPAWARTKTLPNQIKQGQEAKAPTPTTPEASQNNNPSEATN